MHLLTLLILVLMVVLIEVDFELAAILLVLLAIGYLKKYLLPHLTLNLIFITTDLTADALNDHGSWPSVNIDNPNVVLILQKRLGCFSF